MEKNKIKDILELSRHKDANIELLITDAFKRGIAVGIERLKKDLIEVLNSK